MPVDSLSTTSVTVGSLATDTLGDLFCSESLACSDQLGSNDESEIVTLATIEA